jgi:hypothetical protein
MKRFAMSLIVRSYFINFFNSYFFGGFFGFTIK